MTTTSGAPRTETAPAPGAPGAGHAPHVTAIITGALVPHPTMLRTFLAMMAREFRVMGRNLPSTFVRSVMQPLLWVFVFTYVLPKIGAAGVFEAGAARGGPGATTFSTILLPGLMASMLLMQGIMATTFPLVMEFSWQRTIEDRALAPVPLAVLAVQKIAAGAVQAFVGALIVIPIVLYVHAAGQTPHAHVTNWLLLALILVAASMLTAALGLLLGTLMDPRKMQMLFAVILLPATMLRAACITRGRRCTRSAGCRSPSCSTPWCTSPEGAGQYHSRRRAPGHVGHPARPGRRHGRDRLPRRADVPPSRAQLSAGHGGRRLGAEIPPVAKLLLLLAND